MGCELGVSDLGPGVVASTLLATFCVEPGRAQDEWIRGVLQDLKFNAATSKLSQVQPHLKQSTQPKNVLKHALNPKPVLKQGVPLWDVQISSLGTAPRPVTVGYSL